MGRFFKVLNLLSNMGLRYVVFQIIFRLKSKLGWLKRVHPINPKQRSFVSLDEWLELDIPFFEFPQKGESYEIESNDLMRLEENVNRIKSGRFTFFSSVEFDLGSDYDWITNPSTGFKYDIYKHWSEIQDIDHTAGDIKYVWEKSRFSWLYTLIRYDFYANEDQSKFVLDQIEDFIDKNPINQGPNYKCSQEISLRVLNWTYALFFYKNSPYLTGGLFYKVNNSIYWQLNHVYQNINFSRIAVRNNHAITETLTLFLSGVLFPYIPETKVWSKKGQKWFEDEVIYQVYADGSFLQFSHNYHRVVVQLLTWAISLSKVNDIVLKQEVFERAKSTLSFLFNHQDNKTGWLPNYGMNDGALFFPLSSHEFRDYRSQLQALGVVLGVKLYETDYEDKYWLGHSIATNLKALERSTNFFKYDIGGFYGVRNENTLTTVRCGNYKDRPVQADALSLDIWCEGQNMLFDPGTYKYNTDEKYLKFYHGSKGHNTATLGEFDQMVKGGRFIWYYWSKVESVDIKEFDDRFEFEGTISGYKEVGGDLKHTRKIIKYKKTLKWEVFDSFNKTYGFPLIQRWNVNDKRNITIIARDKKNLEIMPRYEEGWNSEIYGVKEEFEQVSFSSNENEIHTIIEINQP